MGVATIAVDARYGLRRPRRGVGEYVYYLMRELADLPHPDYQLVLLGDQSADGEVVREMASAFRVEVLSAPNFFMWEQIAWVRGARRVSARMVHGTANMAPLNWPGPFVLTLHDVIEWHRGRTFAAAIPFRHHVSRFYRMNAVRLLAPRASLLLTVSHHARGDIHRTLNVPLERIRVTPLAAKPLGEPGGFPKDQYFLVLGALDPRKNLAGALAGLALCQTPNIRLQVVGLEERALAVATALSRQWGVSDRVTFSTMISDEELREGYRHARGLVFLSLYEGFGLPVLEAMALGCPVIASNRTAVPEVAGDSAWLVDPENPKAVAEALDTIWQNQDLARRLAASGRERAGHFGWRRLAELTDEGYRAVLAGTS